MLKDLNFTLLNTNKTICTCINDIHDVIAGKPPEAGQQTWRSAKKYAYALGDGSLTTVQALGEAIIVNGVAYTKSTDQAAANYYQMAAGEELMTTWLFAIPQNAKPSYAVSDNGYDLNVSLNEIYAAIYATVQTAFVVVGCIEFAELAASAIAQAPIEGKNIFTHMDTYYPHQLNLTNTSGVIVGVAADMKNMQDHALKTKMEKVVYYNPLESEVSELSTHEHVLILKHAHR